MDIAAHNIIFVFIGFIVGLNMTIFFYQRKMSALYKTVKGLIMEVGAMEFVIRQTEYRLHETNQIGKRMEGVIQGFVKNSSCDNGECDMMIHLLKEFKYVKEANEVTLTHIDDAHRPSVFRRKSDGSGT